MVIPDERERIGLLVFYGLALLLAYLTFLLFRPFLVPLAWAAVLAICFYPLHQRFERRWGPTGAASISTLSVTVIVILPMLMVVSMFVSEAASHFEKVPGILRTLQERLGDRWWQNLVGSVPGAGDVNIATLVTNAAQQATAFLTSQGAALLQNAALFVANLAITIFAMFFLFRDARIVMSGIRRVLPVDDDLRERMLDQTRVLVTASVVSSVIVAATQGLLGGLAFWALGLGAPVFWGVVMACFCLLPFGAWIVWAPAAIWLVAAGQAGKGLLLAAIGAGIVSAVDNVLRPVLLSGRSQINGLLLFVSLLGGVGAFGAVGLVLGPILMATTVGLFGAYVASAGGGNAPEGASGARGTGPEQA